MRIFEQWCDLDAFNPMAMMRRFRPLDEFKEIHHEEHLEEEAKVQKEEKVVEVEKPDDAAARFQRNNDELQSKTLLILRSRISAKDSPDDILKKVMEAYPDPALADEALEFLLLKPPIPRWAPSFFSPEKNSICVSTRRSKRGEIWAPRPANFPKKAWALRHRFAKCIATLPTIRAIL